MPSRHQRPEERIHRAVADVLEYESAVRRFFWFHPPNGGARTKTEAAVFKALGVKSGVPDILAFTPVALPQGMFCKAYGLEIKPTAGRLSDNQRQRQHEMASAGFSVATTWGVDDALERLRAWGLIT